MVEILTEKKVVRGEKQRTIIAVDGVMKREDLPMEYLEGRPYFYGGYSREGNIRDLFIVAGDEQRRMGVYSLRIGETYSEGYFRAALKVMYIAGDRLHELRQKEKELKAVWRGEETFMV